LLVLNGSAAFVFLVEVLGFTNSDLTHAVLRRCFPLPFLGAVSALLPLLDIDRVSSVRVAAIASGVICTALSGVGGLGNTMSIDDYGGRVAGWVRVTLCALAFLTGLFVVAISLVLRPDPRRRRLNSLDDTSHR